MTTPQAPTMDYREARVNGCEWANIYRRCYWPVEGLRFYGGRWLRVCWLHRPAELVLAS
jgi:hypothetical protein